MLDLVTTKVLAMAIMAIISFIVGFFPLRLSRMVGWAPDGPHSKRKDIVTSLLLCLGGGVLMATSLVHMVPQVRKNFGAAVGSTGQNTTDWHTEPVSSDQVPLAEIMICAGFFVVFLIEELVLTFAKEEGPKDETTTTVKRTFSMRKVTKKSSSAAAEGESPKNNNKKESKNDDSGEDKTDDRRKDQNETDQIQTVSTFDMLNDTSNTTDGFNPKYQGRLKASTGMFPTYHPNYEDKKVQRTMRKQEMMQRLFACCHMAGVAGGLPDVPGLPDASDLELPECPVASTKDVLTVAALSVHSVFEGMAIGLESSVADVWKTFGAVTVHKCVVTFCVGSDLVNSDTTNLCSYITFMIIYCLTTPIGVCIGVGVTEGPAHYDHMAVGLLQGLSAGTILYVVIFEVLQREKTKRKVPGLVQLVLIVVGFIIMVCIEVTVPNGTNNILETVESQDQEQEMFHPPIIEAQANHTHS